MKELFTERHGQALPRVAEALDEPTRNALLALVSGRIDDEWFGLSFPDRCPDGYAYAGTDLRRLRDTMEGFRLPWPRDIDREDGTPPGHLAPLRGHLAASRPVGLGEGVDEHPGDGVVQRTCDLLLPASQGVPQEPVPRLSGAERLERTRRQRAAEKRSSVRRAAPASPGRFVGAGCRAKKASPAAADRGGPVGGLGRRPRPFADLSSP